MYFSYQNYYPMRASELMFHSTHPAVQLLNNRKRVMDMQTRKQQK